jgi:hypothetical protein
MGLAPSLTDERQRTREGELGRSASLLQPAPLSATSLAMLQQQAGDNYDEYRHNTAVWLSPASLPAGIGRRFSARILTRGAASDGGAVRAAGGVMGVAERQEGSDDDDDALSVAHSLPSQVRGRCRVCDRMRG